MRPKPAALVMATVTDKDGIEAEPVTIRAEAGAVVFTLDDGTTLWFDEVALNAALFNAVHVLREAS